MSAPLVNRSLATLKTELEFLRDSDVITSKFYDQIVGKLPNRYQAGAAPIDGFSVDAQPAPTQDTPNEKTGALVPQATSGSYQSQNNNAELVEAIYDYKPQQPEDLELRVGDKVQVLEHTSPDWWRGSVGSRSGMFPSNYVKKLDGNQRAQAASPAPSYQSSQYPPPQQQYQGQSPYYPQQQQSPFPPYGSPAPYQQQQQVQYQQPQQQEVVVQQQQHSSAGGHMKKFGSKLGNAAIFGAGATIGSDIVNSIF